MLKLKVNLPIDEYEVHVSYTTRRGNDKQGIFLMRYPSDFLQTDTSQEVLSEKVKEVVLTEIANYNEANPYRAYSNVKILEIRRCGFDTICI